MNKFLPSLSSHVPPLSFPTSNYSFPLLHLKKFDKICLISFSILGWSNAPSYQIILNLIFISGVPILNREKK